MGTTKMIDQNSSSARASRNKNYSCGKVLLIKKNSNLSFTMACSALKLFSKFTIINFSEVLLRAEKLSKTAKKDNPPRITESLTLSQSEDKYLHLEDYCQS